MPSTAPLLSPSFLRRLDALDVVSRKVLRGKLPGERRSKKRGQSVEFADFRNYVVGDDLRFVDWNLFARLDRLFLRLFLEEEDLSVTLLVDTTASMDYGDPRKLDYVLQLSAALSYIALSRQNRLSVFAFDDAIVAERRNLRGRRPIPEVLDFLASLASAPTRDPRPAAPSLAAALRRFALAQRTPGVVVLVSDFFEKGDLAAALRYLADPRFDAYAVQVLSPQEVDPEKGQVIGDLRLRDVEDGDVAEVSVTGALLKRYRANLQAYCRMVRDTCVRRGVTYLAAETSTPFEQVVLEYLRTRGLLG